MDDEDEDTHICLVCHATIVGLENYVTHKKKECTGRKAHPPVTQPSAGRTPQARGTATSAATPLSPSKELAVTTSGSIAGALTSPNTSRAIESGLLMYDEISTKGFTEFLSSLELQYRAPEQTKPTKEQTGSSNALPQTEDRLDDHKSLPIASILNDLEFSDDEDENDDLSNIDADNLMALVDDEDDKHPPRGHTGGKWRPGAGPPPGGKWKPSGKLFTVSKHRQTQERNSIGKQMPGDSPGTGRVEKKVALEGRKTDFATNDGGQPEGEETVTRQESQTPSTFSCDVCNRTFKMEVGLSRHLSTSFHKKRVKGLQLQQESDRRGSLVPDVMGEENTTLECPTCDKRFNSKYNFARHLVSMYHQRRSGKDARQFLLNESMQTLLLRQNPYQCRVCNFYCIEYDVFLRHLRQKSHCDKVSLLIGPLSCQTCKFFTRDSQEMLNHFSKKEHAVRKGDRPCKVKEKRHRVKCPQCNLLVHSAAALKRHLQLTHSGRQRIVRSEKGVRVRPVCSYCKLQCQSPSALTLHIKRIHAKERMHECKVCDRSYSDKHTLSLHKQSRYHHRKAAEAAGISLTEFLDSAQNDKDQQASATAVLNALNRKKRRSFGDATGEDFSCKTCGITFSSVHTLKVHTKSRRHMRMMEMSESGTVLQCATCSQKFDSTNSYINHELKTHIDIGNTEDGKPVKYTGIDEKHMEFLRDMQRTRKTSVQCPECNKRVSSSSIYVHLRNHSNSKPFSCNLCDDRFSDHLLLKHHVVSLHMKLKTFECAHCGKCYNRSSHYHRHLRAAHSTVSHSEQYPCKICGKLFTHMYRVRQHEKMVHAAKLNICTWKGCMKKFSTAYSLKVHTRTHTGEKPYLCQLCGFSCPDQSGMARHRRTHRAKEYPCDYCTYKGTTKAHLKRHMRIHIGSKPYRCLHCDYRCNNVENLKKHCKKHSGKFMYPCKHCTYGTHFAKDMQKHLLVTHSVPLENERHVGLYLGTYEKDHDPDELPEGSCARPVTERRRWAKTTPTLVQQHTEEAEDRAETVGEQLVEFPLFSPEQRLTVIVKGDSDRPDDIIAELEISSVEEVSNVLKAVEAVKLTHPDNGETALRADETLPLVVATPPVVSEEQVHETVAVEENVL